jgi:hypothetical protein
VKRFESIAGYVVAVAAVVISSLQQIPLPTSVRVALATGGVVLGIIERVFSVLGLPVPPVEVYPHQANKTDDDVLPPTGGPGGGTYSSLLPTGGPGGGTYSSLLPTGGPGGVTYSSFMGARLPPLGDDRGDGSQSQGASGDTASASQPDPSPRARTNKPKSRRRET